MSTTQQMPPKDNPWFSNLVNDASVTVGTEATDVINVAIQLRDRAGRDITERGAVRMYLSDDVHGDSIIASPPSGGVAIGTDGILFRNSQLGAVTALTDNSAGTGNNTIQAMANVASSFTIADADIDGTPAHATVEAAIAAGVDAAFNTTLLPAIRNNFADVAAKINELINGTRDYMLVSESDGDIDINITHSGVKTLYVVLVFPSGKISVTTVTFA